MLWRFTEDYYTRIIEDGRVRVVESTTTARTGPPLPMPDALQLMMAGRPREPKPENAS